MEIDHVIDFKDYGLDAETVNFSEDKHKTVGKQIVSVIKKYGYCYLKIMVSMKRCLRITGRCHVHSSRNQWN